MRTIIILLIALAINVYAATTGINTVLNESAIVRLSGAMAMGADANRLVTRSAVESVLSGYNLGSSVVTVTDDVPNDYIVVKYAATNNQYLIDKNTIYTITYNANGGSGAPAAQEHKHNANTTLSSTVPTRTKYRFRGWSTDASATTETYLKGGTYSTNSDVTLYAVWQPEYTITYNANGGSGAPASQIKYHGEPLTLRTEIPVNSNNRFRGWNRNSSATSAEYQPGGEFNIDADTTLYAVWQPIYTITYDANGGTGAPLAQTKYHGEPITLSTTVPTRTNYRFLGWDTNNSATTATYAKGATYTAEGNETLYAIWQAIYTISFDANGGTGAPAAQTKYHGEPITLSSTAPTRTNYTFLGWGVSASSESASYQPGATYTSNGNATLYALWAGNEYTITYHANGGTGAPAAHSYIYAPSGTINLSSTEPTRTGYTFLGWSQSSSAQSASYSPGQAWNRSNASNYDLYAVWSVNTYTITYNANGGSGAPTATTYEYATSGTVPLSSTKPTKTGHTFEEWNTKADGTGTSYAAGAAFSKSVASNTTLYAIYDPNTYTITFNDNGGSGGPGSQSYTYATSGTFNLSTTKPTRTGHSFQGWGTGGASDTSVDYAAGAAFSYATASNTTLHAIWKADTYTVSFNANGGSGAPSAQTKTYGVALTLSSTKPTRTGHTFQGWGTSASDTSVDYAAGGSYTANSGATLYAIWTANTYTVVYNGNGNTGGSTASSTHTYGVAKNLTANGFTKTGNNFSGWATSTTGSVVYSNQQSVTNLSSTQGATVNLYAKWTLQTYTVSYNANGGSGAPAAQTKTYGQNLTLSSTKPTRSGHTFQGWGTSASDTSVDYAAGATYTANSGITLYAIWKVNAFYAIQSGSLVACPNASCWGGGHSNGSGTDTTNGYYGGWGHTNSDPDSSWGATTGSVSTNGCPKVTIETYVYNWGWTGPSAQLTVKSGSTTILDTWLGADSQTTSRTIDVSAYSNVTIRINTTTDGGEDGGDWIAVGFKNIRFHD